MIFFFISKLAQSATFKGEKEVEQGIIHHISGEYLCDDRYIL